MAYERLVWPMVSTPVSAVLSTISYQCADIRELMIARGPDGGLSIATLLAVLTDSAANLLQPGVKEPADRFKKFVNDNFPWHVDAPYGLVPQDATDLLWEIVRTPAVHRMGLQPNPPFQVRYVMLFTPTDELLSQIETSADRPFSEPTIKFDGRMLTVQLESWYWALRRAVINAVDTKDKVAAVVKHLQSGDYARTNSLYKLLKANVPRSKKV
jgi:hypothetical protein